MKPLTLFMLVLSACAERSPGIEVAVSMVVSPSASTNDLAFDLARLHVSSVRGVPCEERLARAFTVISTAQAHGGHAEPEATPLRTAVGRDLDLTVREPQTLGVIRPPPGVWCALEVEVGPSPETATSLLVDARSPAASRRYLSASTRRLQQTMAPLLLEVAGRRSLVLLLDAGPTLASLDPAANDARRDLLDTLLASLQWNDP